MKFSLRTFLIVVCVVGATAGVMGNLLLNRPETFINVVHLSATVLPFLLAVGTIIALGLKSARRSGLVAWGVTLLLFPVAMRIMLSYLLPSSDPLWLMSTKRIIAQRLPSQVGNRSIWKELQRRLERGSVPADDVDGAVGLMVSHMIGNRPGGWKQSLPCGDTFLKIATGKQLVSDEVLLELCDAFYGAQPEVSRILPIRKGQGWFDLEVELGDRWSASSGMTVALL